MIYNLQVLRACAAYMVVLFHFMIFLRPFTGDGDLIGVGAAGVDIFFVISGFIMVATTAGRSVTVGDFLLRRVARLVPVYWFVTLGIVLLVLVGVRPIGVMEVPARDVVQSLLFLPFLRGPLVEPIVYVGWTLNYEMFFYLVFAGLLLVRSDRLRIAGLCAILVGLGLSSLAEPSGFYARFYTRPIVIDFALGALLGYAYHHTRERPVGPGVRAAGYGLLGAGILILAVGEIVAHRMGTTVDALPFRRLLVWGTAGLSIVAGALALERGGRVWRSPFLIEQGNASYAIYLIHSVVLQAASKVAALVAPASLAGVGLTFVLALPTIAILGVLLHRGLERPLNRGVRSAVHAMGRRTNLRRSVLPPIDGSMSRSEARLRPDAASVS